jgi:hypothetical protein
MRYAFFGLSNLDEAAVLRIVDVAPNQDCINDANTLSVRRCTGLRGKECSFGTLSGTEGRLAEEL